MAEVPTGSTDGSRKKRQSEERALRKGRANDLVQETLLGEAAAGMLAALFVFSEDYEMVAVNEAASALTGWTREELLANPAELPAGDARRAAQLRAELLANGRLVGTGSLRTKSGELVEVSYVASMTRAARMPFIVLVAAAPSKPAARATRARASRSAG
jgi:PAS domain S-box-containing protein